MLRAIRHSALIQRLSLAMLLCVVAVSVSALLHSDDDRLCSVALEHHDHNAHRIGGANAPAPDASHCFICHNQSLRSLVSTGAFSSPRCPATRLDADRGSQAGPWLSRRQPARAPPLA